MKPWVVPNQRLVAEALGVQPRTVRSWLKAGCAGRVGEAAYDLIAIARWAERRSLAGGPDRSTRSDDVAKLTWAERLERAKARREERKDRAEAGEYFTRPHVETMVKQRATALVAGLDALAATAAIECSTRPAAEIQQVLEGRVRDLRAAYVGEQGEWVKLLDSWAAMTAAGAAPGKKRPGRPRKARTS